MTLHGAIELKPLTEDSSPPLKGTSYISLTPLLLFILIMATSNFVTCSCSHMQPSSMSPHLHPQPPLLPPMPTEPALLCCPGEVQGLLSQVLQPVRDRASSSFFMTLGQLFHDAQERDGTSSTQPSDINTDPGSSPDQGCLPGFWW